MPGFIYYLPGKPSYRLEEIRQAGLGYAFEANPPCCGVANGPDGQHGAVFARDDVRLGYYPDRQTWRRVPKSAAWVGYAQAEIPTPELLRREETLAGHWVRMGDGCDWLCPVARGIAGTEDAVGWYLALPSVLTLTDSGEWAAGDVEARYRPLWELAEAYWDAFSGAAEQDGAIRFDFQGLPDAAVMALQANYRIGRAEAALLGLFDDKGVRAALVLQALVDWPSWQALLKKRLAADTPPFAAGQPDSAPATVPA